MRHILICVDERAYMYELMRSPKQVVMHRPVMAHRKREKNVVVFARSSTDGAHMMPDDSTGHNRKHSLVSSLRTTSTHQQHTSASSINTTSQCMTRTCISHGAPEGVFGNGLHGTAFAKLLQSIIPEALDPVKEPDTDHRLRQRANKRNSRQASEEISV